MNHQLRETLEIFAFVALAMVIVLTAIAFGGP